jgi:hypothetical protein
LHSARSQITGAQQAHSNTSTVGDQDWRGLDRHRGVQNTGLEGVDKSNAELARVVANQMQALGLLKAGCGAAYVSVPQIHD